MKEIIISEIQQHITAFNSMHDLVDRIEIAASNLIDRLNKGGKLLIFGNGGSAADAQHIAAELVGRYKINRKGMPAVALTTDTSAITAIANDFEYNYIFKRQLESLMAKDDAVIGISTSGKSKNVIEALRFAHSHGVYSIALTGENPAEMSQICNVALNVPSTDTARIQEMHIFIGHTLCHLIDQNFSE